MKTRMLIALLAFLAMGAVASARSAISDAPLPKFTAEEAIAKARKQFKTPLGDKSMFLIAVVWSRLTCMQDQHHMTWCCYVEPVSHRNLNMGVAGGSDEWSWYVTFARNPAKKHLRGADDFLTFQVRTNAEVNLIYSDN